jgi:hypothetical protein
MGIAGHDGFPVFAADLQQSPGQFQQQFADAFHLIVQIKQYIQCHLIIAAARGVQFLAHITDFGGQECFDIHMHVIGFHRKLEPALSDFLLDFLQGGDDLFPFFTADDSLLGHMAAWAMLPLISWAYMRLSKAMEALKTSVN